MILVYLTQYPPYIILLIKKDIVSVSYPPVFLSPGLDGISLPGRSVFNIKYSLSVYSKNRLTVPTQQQSLCTTHFAKRMKNYDRTPTNHISSRSKLPQITAHLFKIQFSGMQKITQKLLGDYLFQKWAEFSNHIKTPQKSCS